jgi:hypothetical protein
MVCAAEGELAGAGIAEAATVVVTNAGYWLWGAQTRSCLG